MIDEMDIFIAKHRNACTLKYNIEMIYTRIIDIAHKLMLTSCQPRRLSPDASAFDPLVQTN
jgi:hypothetical protein